MFCPKCASPILSESIQFCTKCGFAFGEPTYRKEAIKKSFVLIAIGLLLIPVWMFIGAAFPPDDRLVESSPSTTWPEMVAWILMWMAFIGGAVRLGYAWVFERA